MCITHAAIMGLSYHWYHRPCMQKTGEPFLSPKSAMCKFWWSPPCIGHFLSSNQQRSSWHAFWPMAKLKIGRWCVLCYFPHLLVLQLSGSWVQKEIEINKSSWTECSVRVLWLKSLKMWLNSNLVTHIIGVLWSSITNMQIRILK